MVIRSGLRHFSAGADLAVFAKSTSSTSTADIGPGSTADSEPYRRQLLCVPVRRDCERSNVAAHSNGATDE